MYSVRHLAPKPFPFLHLWPRSYGLASYGLALFGSLLFFVLPSTTNAHLFAIPVQY